MYICFFFVKNVRRVKDLRGLVNPTPNDVKKVQSLETYMDVKRRVKAPLQVRFVNKMWYIHCTYIFYKNEEKM